MGSITIPKALYPINGKSNLQSNLEKLDGIIPQENVIVVANNTTKPDFEKFKENNNLAFRIIAIDSGKGDGHAVLESLEQLRCDMGRGEREVIIMWGDAHLESSEIVEELKNAEMGSGYPMIFPVSIEPSPYVHIEPECGTLDVVTKTPVAAAYAQFSKHGDDIPETGYHDQSIFKVRYGTFINALREMNSFYLKGNKYITPSKELNLLHIVHCLFNSEHHLPALMYLTNHEMHSFNSVLEAEEIEKKLN
ncbi:hypothetical protein RsoM2USA_486 [Ralstonia phage RsoM2USA]|nr:hypothetical protein RsoM2USA_486 [Ralstonia phage RsoM2USA]